MKCPFCQHIDTQVLDSRVSEEGDAVRRRRRCESCGKRFTTYERADLQWPMVVKRDGSRVDFDVRKLRASMLLALRKRPVSQTDIDVAIVRIEEQVLSTGQREIASELLGGWVMDALRSLDRVGFIRYASVYHSFDDLDAFVNIIRQVQKPRKGKADA